jgi:hypothetical protein
LTTTAFQAQAGLLGLHAGDFGIMDAPSAVALQSGPGLVNVLQSTVWSGSGVYAEGDVVTDPDALFFWVAVGDPLVGFAPWVDGAALYWKAVGFFDWMVQPFYNLGVNYDSGPTYDSFGLTFDQ